MKALSIRQPWMWAILAGGKDVENRSRNVVGGHRGPILLHVGKQLADQDAFARVSELADDRMPNLGGPGNRPELHSESAIVGVVNIAGVHQATSCRGRCSPWADPTGWHLRLHDPRPLRRPVPCPGRLGLFTPDQQVLDDVRRQLA